MIELILSKIIINQNKILIVGPGNLCNLLAKSLSALMSPLVKEQIVYYEAAPINNCSCTNQTEPKQIFDFPNKFYQQEIKA